jgi:hypothetical protein
MNLGMNASVRYESNKMDVLPQYSNSMMYSPL